MNHIEQILDTMDETSDIAPSHCWQRLTIRAICAVAKELRGIGNMMAWGAADDIPDRVPAEAGEVALELDEALSEVATHAELYTGECIYPDDDTCNCQYYSNCAHIHIAQGDE